MQKISLNDRGGPCFRLYQMNRPIIHENNKLAPRCHSTGLANRGRILEGNYQVGFAAQQVDREYLKKPVPIFIGGIQSLHESFLLINR